MFGTRQLRRRPALAAAALVASLLAAVPLTSTFADLQTVDGDLVAPGIQRTVARAAAPTATVTVTARLQVNFQNPSHVAPGATVAFVVDPATTTLPAGYQVGGATVSIPATWKGGSVAVAATTSTITFTGAATKGTRTYQVGWKASPAVTGITASRTLNIRVKTSGAQPPPPDTTPPVLILPTLDVGAAVGPDGAVITFTVTALDAVDGPTEVECDHEGGSGFPIGTTLVTCTSSDDSGNVATGSFNVVVLDQVAPVFQAMAPITVSAAGPGTTVNFTPPRAVDFVDGVVPVTCDPPPGSPFPLGTTPITCTATDTHGNQAQTVVTIVVTDTDAPVLAVPGDLTVEATGPSGAIVDYAATATDAVEGPVATSCAPAPATAFALGATNVTCSATDGSANTSSASFAVLVHDTTAPVVTVPEHVVVEATGSDGAVATFPASATDLVSGPVSTTCTSTSGSTFSLGDTTVTCAAVDAAGNTGTAAFVVQVLDTTAPVLTLPGDLEPVEATDGSGAVVNFQATAVDAVDGSVTTTCSEAAGEAFAVGTTVVTCDAVDAAGNTRSASFSVTVLDSTAPTLTLPASVIAEATGPEGASIDYSITGFDAVSGLVAVSCDVPAGSVVALGTATVTCVATDDSANTATGSFTVTVVDTTAPELALPPVQDIEATGPSGAHVAYGAATAVDVVDPDVTTSCTPATGTVFAIGETTVTCTATDAADNTATAAFVVMVSDRTAPDLVVPESVTAEATSPDGAVVTYEATAADAVSGSELAVTCDHPSGTVLALGATTVTCTVTDGAGNERTASFEVSVVDTTAPELTAPSDILDVEAAGPDGTAVAFTASATDAVDGPVTVTCSVVSGTTFALGNTVVTCAATDAAGNEATGSFTVNVTDAVAPQLQLPAATTVEADGPAGSQVTFAATALDLVDGTVLASCTPASTTVFPVGDTTVACSATDAAGNVASGSFVVHVVDRTGPQLGLPSDITLEATGADGAAVAYETSATDAVDGSLAVTCTLPSGGTAPLGTSTVSCSSTDAAGNTTSGTFHLTVLDTTSPTVTLPGSVTIGAVGPDGAIVTYAVASATDVVGGSLPATCDPSSGSLLALGTTTVTCTATDAQGNLGQASFVVTVTDQDAPVVAVPQALVVEATSGAGATATFSSSAHDNVDGPIATTCLPPSGSAFAHQVATTVTCTATDAAGNVGHSSFILTVVDSTPPVLTLPAPITVEATAPGTPVSYSASAMDIVDGAVTPNCTKASGATFAIGSTTVQCDAFDAQGNLSSGSFEVLVTDTVAPTFTPPANVTTQAATGAGIAVTFAAGTATDAGSGAVPILCSPAADTLFPVGSTLVTCSATDGAGNTHTATFTVTITPAPPSAPGTVVATAGIRTVTVTFGTPADDGGAPITGYLVTCTAGASTVTATGGASPITVTGLNPGASYTCTVVALNGTGAGAASAGSPAVPIIGPMWVGFNTGVVATSVDGLTWSAATSPGVLTARAAASSGSRVVIVGNGGMLTSVNGTDWTPPNNNWGFDYLDVTYGGGYFVAIGRSGYVAYSSDGLNWGASPALGDGTWILSDVQYAFGRFVVTGYNPAATSAGGIAYSTNGGTSWTEAAGMASLRGSGVAYGNGRWWATGAICSTSSSCNNQAPTSVDGVNWTLVANPSARLGPVAYGGGRFVAGNISTTGVSTVADGFTSWGVASTIGTSNQPVYGNGVWIAGGTSGSMVQSANGTNWAGVAYPGGFGGSPSFGGGLFAVGGGSAKFAMVTSTDGLTWVQHPTPYAALIVRYVAPPIEPPLVLPDVPAAVNTTAGNGYVQVGFAAQTWQNGWPITGYQASCTANGPTTSVVGTKSPIFVTQLAVGTPYTCTVRAQNSAGWGPASSPSAPLTPYQPSQLWVGLGTAGVINTSLDGATWVAQRAPITGVAATRAVAYSGSRLVVVGDSELFTSAEGSAWTTVFPPATQLKDVAYGAGRFVAVGQSGAILSSTDGLTWTAASYHPAFDIYDLHYAAGRFVLAGNNSTNLIGGIASSTDGVSWTAVAGTTAFKGGTRGIAYGNGRWWITGTTCTTLSNCLGRAATSTNGTTWTLSYTTPKLGPIAYGGGRFVATNNSGPGVAIAVDGSTTWQSPVGTGSGVMPAYGNGIWMATTSAAGTRSTDGVTWTPVTLPVALGPLVFGGGQFAAGNNTGTMYTSPDGLSWTPHPMPNNGTAFSYLAP